jgi:hypothetical protein
MHGAGCRLKHGWLAARSRGPGCLVRQCPHAAQAKACGLGRALGVGRSELCRRRLLPTSAGWQPHVGPGVCGARCPGVRAGPYEFALKTRSCVIRGGKLPYSLTKSSCFFLAIGFHMTEPSWSKVNFVRLFPVICTMKSRSRFIHNLILQHSPRYCNLPEPRTKESFRVW